MRCTKFTNSLITLKKIIKLLVVKRVKYVYRRARLANGLSVYKTIIQEGKAVYPSYEFLIE